MMQITALKNMSAHSHDKPDLFPHVPYVTGITRWLQKRQAAASRDTAGVAQGYGAERALRLLHSAYPLPIQPMISNGM